MLVSSCVNGTFNISRANHANALVSLGKHDPAYPRCPSFPGTFMCVFPMRGSVCIIFVNVCQSVPLDALSTSYISFMNEMYDVLKASRGTDWQTFTKIIQTDPRMGNTHMKVPGNDGQRGYAGSCFPKDTSALAWFAREILNVPFTQLETSIEINENLRKKNLS